MVGLEAYSSALHLHCMHVSGTFPTVSVTLPAWLVSPCMCGLGRISNQENIIIIYPQNTTDQIIHNQS